MEGLKLVPYVTLVLLVAGVIIAASVITLSKFGDVDSITKCVNTSYAYNESRDECALSGSVGNITSGGKGANFSSEFYAIYQSEEGVVVLAENQATVAIIAIMVIIIAVLAGVFVYFRYFG